MSRFTGDTAARGWLCAAILPLAAAACSSSARLDLCGRGDRVDFEGGVRVSFLDEDGQVIDVGEVTPDPSAHLDLDAPGGAVEVLIEGLDGDRQVVAHGRAPLEDDGACVCVAQEAQYQAACERVACVAGGDECEFVDADSGQPVGTRTLSIGENADDAASGATDTFMRESNGTGNFGQDVDLNISGDETGLLRFDLRALPSGTLVESATLSIFATDNGSDEELEVTRVLESWAEGSKSDGSSGAASWLEREVDTPWSVAGCGAPDSRDVAPLASFAPIPLEESEISSSQLTDAVQQWIQESADNFGVAMTCSCDASLVSSQGEDGRRPRLAVTFTLP